MAITSERFLNPMSSPSAWTNTWAKANAQVKKVKTQSDFLDDVQKRLYLPQIQQSPNVQLYSKTYRLAAARRRHGTKRKRLQREADKDSIPKLPDIRQTWSLFEGLNANIGDESPRQRRNSDPDLPPINDAINTKHSTKQKGRLRYHADNNHHHHHHNKENSSLPISLVVDYTNRHSLHRQEEREHQSFPQIPSYPARRGWKKHSVYRRTLEPIERRDHRERKKREKRKDSDAKIFPIKEELREHHLTPLPQIQQQKSVDVELKEVERAEYRLKLTEQNIDEYRKEQERKMSAGRRIRAPPNSAKSLAKRRRKSKQQSDSVRRKSKDDKLTTKINDDSGFSSKTTTESKRKISHVEDTNNEQINSGEPTNLSDEHAPALYHMSEAKREQIEKWLEQCEEAKPDCLPVPGDPNEDASERSSSVALTTDGEVEEVKMPFEETAPMKNLVVRL